MVLVRGMHQVDEGSGAVAYRVYNTIVAPELPDRAACADVPQEHLPVATA